MKKLLLISYYFPPCGGASVQRWLKLIRYLPDYGWQPTVLTTSEGDYPVLDSSLCKKIPNTIKVIRTKTPAVGKILNLFKNKKERPYPYGSLQAREDDSLTKKALYWIRLNLIVPDSRVIWNKTAYHFALQELRKKKYDLVVTTGPPHSTHLVALELRKHFPIKWIADFRDPWTKIYYLQELRQNKMLLRLNQKLEKSVLRKAQLNIIISERIADSLPPGKKHILPNGFDPEDYFNINTVPSSFFRVKFVGKQTEGQDIKTPLKWLNELSKEQSSLDIEFSFIGTHSAVSDYKRDYPNLHVRNIGFITHLRAISEMVNADLLLLLINNCPDNKGILTTKLFEYLGSRTYIIGLGPVAGDAAEILNECHAGKMIDYGDRQGFFAIVRNIYREWHKGKSIKNKKDISKYSTPSQAKDLSLLFEQLASENADHDGSGG
jgi:hypothetical protein